jgi:hypothetical protein
MKLLLENWQEYLNERVYGNLITAYSRTSRLSNIKSMLKNGWRIGDYGDFDPGIYLVYNLEESEYADRWYGTYVMKFAIKTNNKFLIFDPDAAKIVYGENSDLRSQIELIDPKLLGNERVESYIVRKEKYGGASIYGFPPELKDSVNGIMINTGPKKDGYVAVIYKPENVLTMISWAKIPELYSVEKLPREKWKAAVRASQSGADELLLRLIEKYDGDVYKLKTNPPTQEELEAIAETIRYPEITEEDSLRALKEFYTYDYDLRDLDDLSLEELIWTIYQEEGTDWSGLSAMEIVEELIGYEPSLSEYIQTGKKSALRNIKRFLNIRDRGARDFEATTFDEYIEWMKKIGLDPQKRTDPYSRETLEWNREVDGIQLPQRIKLA